MWQFRCILLVVSPEFVARRGKAVNLLMGHSRQTSGPGAAAARWLIVLRLIERAASCWQLHQLILQTTQYLVSWLSDLLQSKLKWNCWKSRGHVPQWPIADDATLHFNLKAARRRANGSPLQLRGPQCISVRLSTFSTILLGLKTPNFGLAYRPQAPLRRPVSKRNMKTVILKWNSLPDHVVSADTINTFKDRLDKFWSTQDVVYDYIADLHGIGNRIIII